MSSRSPLYPRLLRLRHVHPNGWQRAALGEGAIAVAGVLVLADLATAWTLLVLPLAVAAVVKGHDLVAGVLARPGAAAAAGRDGRTGGAADAGRDGRAGEAADEDPGTDPSSPGDERVSRADAR